MQKSYLALGTSQRLGKAVRILRPPCAARRTAAGSAHHLLLSEEQQHLQRSLDLGPAYKQAPDFEYVTVAFRTQPRSKRRRDPRRGGKPPTKSVDLTNKIFGPADESGFRTLEVVSGDRRLLFEPKADEDTGAPKAMTTAPRGPTTPVDTDSARSPSAPTAPRTMSNGTPHSAPADSARSSHSISLPHPPSTAAPAAAGGPANPTISTSAAGSPAIPHSKVPRTLWRSTESTTTAAASHRPTFANSRRQPQPSQERTIQPHRQHYHGHQQRHVSVEQPHLPHPQHPLHSEQRQVDLSLVLPASATSRSPSRSRPAPPLPTSPAAAPPTVVHNPVTPPHPHTTPPAAVTAAQELPITASHRSRSPKHQDNVHDDYHSDPDEFEDGDADEDDSTAHTSGHRNTQLTAALEAAAVGILRLPLRSLRACRRLHSELMTLPDPEVLIRTCIVLVRDLGLTSPQVRHVLTCQPHVLRLPHAVLAARGAALAAELAFPPPRSYDESDSAAADASELAAVVTAAPDVLLRRGGYSGTCAALAEALALPDEDAARELLRRVPQILRHPPAFFRCAVSNLQRQLGMHRRAAVALTSTAPVLLVVSPGVLSANGTLLRQQLQLTPAQLAEVVSYAPELLARPPGALRAVVMRLTGVLTRSGHWRRQLPRLLASGRNTAVALSFGSERYERLEYLAETGRDGVMGFKDALTLEESEFEDVFPEYPEWRRAAGR